MRRIKRFDMAIGTKRSAVSSRQSGSMLLLAVMVLAIVSLLIIVGIVLNSMLFVQKRVQSQTDALALTVAQDLNESDRAGQMNNMVSYCRELVFNSRQTERGIAQRYPHLEPLARHLLDQARRSAQFMEAERQRLVATTILEASNTLETGSALSSTSEISIPWMKTSNPRVIQATLGSISEVESNAAAPFGNEELLEFDWSKGYLQKDSNLYFGNIDAKLPAPDDDLTFKLSSLPFPVKGTIAPIRLLSPSVFKGMAKIKKDGQAVRQMCDQIPSAIYLTVSMNMSTGQKDARASVVETRAAATAVGATPAP